MPRYELLFIVDAKSDAAARRAANAAWTALDSTTGVGIKDCSARRRARKGRPVAVDWEDWQETPEFSFRVTEEGRVPFSSGEGALPARPGFGPH
jgi:hypothetical protein